MADRLPRRLAAILYADVAEYSRLTGEDEDATHRALSEFLDLVSRIVQSHRGRVMHYAGDAVLAKFDAVLDAMSAALEIQKSLKIRNACVPSERRVQFRIGVNLGDVIEDRDDIYGEGVNVAARLEGLSDPGGVCISEAVRNAIGKKLPLTYEFMGEKSVKNIAEPVRAYRVILEPKRTLIPSPVTRSHPPRPVLVLAGSILILIAVGTILWQLKDPPAWLNGDHSSQAERPSIAVLPFVNISADPEQEYFSDGIADDLITDLSKVSGLIVISRNSSFSYKGKSPDIREVARALDVTHVLEGSVRRVGNDVRINVQLIDGSTGSHLWADRYDATMDDVFKLQDQINAQVVNELRVRLNPEEAINTTDRGTTNVAAYDLFLKGWGLVLRKSPEDAIDAINYFNRALELDPEFNRALAALAQTYWDYRLSPEFIARTGPQAGENMEFGYYSILQAWTYLKKGDSRPTSQSKALLSRLLQRQRRFDDAVAAAQEAVELGPNNPDAYDSLIENLIYAGQTDEAIHLANDSIRLDPRLPGEKLFLIGLAHYTEEKLDEAVNYLSRARKHNPHQSRYAAIHAAALAGLKKNELASDALDDYLSGLLIFARLDWIMLDWPFQDRATLKRLADNFILAGLPDSRDRYFLISSRDRLVGDELNSLLSGNTVVALDQGPYGLEDEVSITRTDQLQIIEQSPFTYFSQGKSRIENGLLCDPWWEHGDYCVAIYRNAEGTPANRNEYVFFTLTGAFTFSVVDAAS